MHWSGVLVNTKPCQLLTYLAVYHIQSRSEMRRFMKSITEFLHISNYFYKQETIAGQEAAMGTNKHP